MSNYDNSIQELAAMTSDEYYWAVEHEQVDEEMINLLKKIRSIRLKTMDWLVSSMDEVRARIALYREQGYSEEAIEDSCNHWKKLEDQYLNHMVEVNKVNEELEDLGYDIRAEKE